MVLTVDCVCHGVGAMVVWCLIGLLQFEEVSELQVGNGLVVVVQFDAMSNGHVEVQVEEL